MPRLRGYGTFVSKFKMTGKPKEETMATMLNAVPAAAWIPQGDTDFSPQRSESSEHASITSAALAKTFRVAVLLTGGVRQAEAAMLDAMQRMDPEQVSNASLFTDCVRASLATGRQSKA